MGSIRPTQRLRWTTEGGGYILIWFVLLAIGLYQQINLVLLIAGLAAGPILGSMFVSAAMLRGLHLTRKTPPYVFSGETLTVEYQLENHRRWTDALALTAMQPLVPVESNAPGAVELLPTAFFPRVPGRERRRRSWRTTRLVRGRYLFRPADLVTRSPFGLLERSVTIDVPGELVVYPSVGTLTRRWRLIHREATESRRGRRHDRSSQQQEYHGLRDYRPGDSPRWIHWRTTARIGAPMVKEFEQQNEQDIALLVDPWMPRSKPTPDQRDAVEESIRFAASVCMDVCRNQGRRVLLGWTGPSPGVIHSPASIKTLHELLRALALMRPAHEGSLGRLFDALPSPIIREALLVVVTTRTVNLARELEESSRLGDGTARNRLFGRLVLLDASRGDLNDLVRFENPPASWAGPPPEIDLGFPIEPNLPHPEGAAHPRTEAPL